jgi:hypothetical protein
MTGIIKAYERGNGAAAAAPFPLSISTNGIVIPHPSRRDEESLYGNQHIILD